MEEENVRRLRKRDIPLTRRQEDVEVQQRGNNENIVGSQRGTGSNCCSLVADGEDTASHVRREEVVSRHGSNVSRKSLQSQLEEAEAESRFRTQAREIARKKEELQRQEEELRRQEEELEEHRRLERLRRAVERASAAGSVAGGSKLSQISLVPSVHHESPGTRVRDWVREQNSQVEGSVEVPCELSNNPREMPPISSQHRPTIFSPPRPLKNNMSCPHSCQQIHFPMETYFARKSMGKALPSFSGDPSEWLHFITSFRSSNSICKFTPEENLQRISKALNGRAKESVRSLLCVPNSIDKIINILELQYGRPILIINNLIEQVKKFPRLAEDNLHCIIDLATKVYNLTVAIEALEENQFFTNPQLVEEIVNKLNANLKLQWGETVIRLGKSADLRDLNDFLYNKAVAVNHASSSLPTKINARQVHTITEFNDSKSCLYCKENHKIARCDIFLRLSIPERRKWVGEKKLCFLCMGKSHRASKCRVKKRCDVNDCQALHHSLLHLDRLREPDIKGSDRLVAHSSNASGSTLLKILPVRVKGPLGSTVVTALLDEGADCSLMDSNLATSLGLKGKTSPLCIQWIQGDKRSENESMIVELSICGINKNNKVYNLTNVRTVNNMSLPRQNINVNKLKTLWPQIKNIPLDFSDKSPSLLIGQDHWNVIETIRSLRRSWNGLGVSKTRLGWVVHGRMGHDTQSVVRPLHICQIQKSNDTLHELIIENFNIENLYEGSDNNYNKSMSGNDHMALDVLNKTAKFLGKQWEVGLLWRYENTPKVDSRGSALRRLYCVEHKMSIDKNFEKQYKSKMSEYISKGYAKKLDKSEITSPSNRKWYLPHLAVFNPNKPGKIRVVFDASAKTKGISLNDQLLKGPDLYNSLPGILLRFRKGKFAFGGDIRDMFLKIKIREEDQGAQRFLWREDRRHEPEEYLMQVMLFGAICSPFQAQYVRNLNAKRFSDTYPQAVQAVHQAHYMDDYLDSADTEEDAVDLIAKIIKIHADGGFDMVGWFSNSLHVLESVKGMITNPEDVHLDPSNIEKVLGLRYIPNRDCFIFQFNRKRIPPDVTSKLRRITKREFLKIVMSIFDPLGFLNWWTIRAKLILQDIWRSKIDWDDEVNDAIGTRWENWIQEIDVVEKLEINRHYSPLLLNATEIQLHTFCDASDRAFAAACYIKIIRGDNASVSLIASKSRVAPLKQLSVPRLELQAAVSGARLAAFLLKESGINFDKQFYWSDSKTVIHWVYNHDARYKMFVAHRLGEVVRLTKPEQWRWVPGLLNPADSATKVKVCNLERWFKGPEFLYGGEETWPISSDSQVDTGNFGELERLNLVLSSQPPSGFLPDIDRFSNFSRLIRATAWILRFSANLKKFISRFQQQNVTADPNLQFKEERTAERLWWKHLQLTDFSQDIAYLQEGRTVNSNSKLYRLSPFLDDQGILRVRGRIEKVADVPYGSKHPVILDSRNRFVELLIDKFHRKANHQGQEYVMNELRQTYWILGLRRAVRRSWHRCLLCARERSKPFQQPMGPLPPERLHHNARPFSNVGLDYFGPLMVTVRRSKEKRYAALFSCMTTRAIHLELIQDLTTEGTLLAIRRMAARRGYPKTIWSDNGTNFRGAQRVIKDCLNKMDQKKIVEELGSNQIEWNFLPPSAPHMGGSWERLIRSVKKSLTYTLKSQAPREDVLSTLLSEAENLINSRPITKVSDDPDDPEALTPNHFLLGSSNGLPRWEPKDEKFDLRKRWQLAQHLTDHFWRRWLKEYLPSLVKSSKWFGKAQDIEVNKLVYLADQKERRGIWKPGRIVAVYPGTDGRTRVVDVKTSEGIIRRPVCKLLPLSPPD